MHRTRPAGDCRFRRTVSHVERLVVSKNLILAILRPSAVERVAERVDAVISMAESLPDAPTEPQRLPAGFEDLEDLLGVWAIADDERRAEQVASAPDAALASLQDRVSPSVGRINEELGQRRGQPLSSDLVALGLLAEVATEAGIELRRRRGS